MGGLGALGGDLVSVGDQERVELLDEISKLEERVAQLERQQRVAELERQRAECTCLGSQGGPDFCKVHAA